MGSLYIFCVRREPSKLGGEKIFRQPALRALNKNSSQSLSSAKNFCDDLRAKLGRKKCSEVCRAFAPCL